MYVYKHVQVRVSESDDSHNLYKRESMCVRECESVCENERECVKERESVNVRVW